MNHAMRRIGRTALYDVRVMLRSSRFLMVSLAAFMFMDISMRPVKELASAFHLGVVPASLPFYLSDGVYGNIVLLLLLLMFSDIPLKNGAQNYLLQRGRSLRSSGAAHVLSLFLVGGVFVLEQVLFSVLTALPHLLFGDWGKVWGSFASHDAMELGYLIGFATPESVMRSYTPWQAVGAAASLFFLVGCIYALAEYILNGLSRGRLGTAVLSAWTVAWIFLVNGPFPWMRRLAVYLPQNWIDLSRFGPEKVPGRAGVLAVAVLALSAVAVFLVKRRKIEMVK